MIGKIKIRAWSKWTLRHLHNLRVLKSAGLVGRSNQDWRNVAEHLLVVNAFSIFIGEKVISNGRAVDLNLIDAASIVHDVAKRMEKKRGLGYPEAPLLNLGSGILRETGYPEEIIKAVEHIGKVPDTVIENPDEQMEALKRWSLEWLIMGYADARTRNADIVTLEAALTLNKRKVPADAELYDRWHRFFKRGEEALKSLTNEDPARWGSKDVLAMVQRKTAV